MSGGNFDQVVIVDFEFEADAGELPQPLCMVAYVLNENLQHVRTIHLWRGEFGSAPPFDIGPNTLVVGYSLWWGLALVALFWGIGSWRKRKAPEPANEAAPQA